MRIKSYQELKSLLFENQTVKQTIFKNTFWLAVAEGISRFLTLILFIYVARILGATEYGKFAFAIAFIYLLSILSSFVSPQIITREFSQDKTKEKEYSSILSLKILLGLGTLILIFISSFFIVLDPLIQKVIWILAIYSFLNCFFEIFYAFLRAHQRMEYEAWAKILQAICIATFGFFVILRFPSVENLSYGYLLASLVSLTIFLSFFHLKVYRLSLEWDKSIWKRILLMSWPLALVGTLTIIYTQIDSVMMGYFGQITETGWYNAVYKITGAALIPMVLISQSFYPVLSRAFKESKERIQKIWNSQMEIMIFLAFPITVGGIVLAPKIIDFIYDQSYAPSVLAFQILILMVGIMFLYNSFYQVLIVSDNQKKIFWAVFIGAIVNVILNLILIPKFSLYGAAVATVITNLLIFFLFFRFTLKFTSIKPFNSKFLFTFINAALSGMAMCFVIVQPQVYHFHVLLSILIGIIVYFVCIFGCKKLIKYIFPLWPFRK